MICKFQNRTNFHDKGEKQKEKESIINYRTKSKFKFYRSNIRYKCNLVADKKQSFYIFFEVAMHR